jgi:hypothetical protein
MHSFRDVDDLCCKSHICKNICSMSLAAASDMEHLKREDFDF